MAAPSTGTGRGSTRGVLLAVMCAGYFLVLLDVTIVNVALPHIRLGLHTSVAGLQWVVDGYAIALASTMLAAGTIGDVHGHRRVVLGGFAVFGAASVACALALTSGELIAGRVAQGIGAAMLLPGTLAVITHEFAEAGERARAIGIWAGLGSAALPAGPLLGGALVQWLGWRAVFFVNLPIVAAAALVAFRVAPDVRGDARRRVDFLGTLLGGTLLALVTFTFIAAGKSGVHAAVVAAGLAGSCVLGAFVFIERRAADPALPLALFRRPGFSAANAAAATMNLVTLGILFALTLYLQSVRGLSPVEAGVVVLPLFLPLVVLAPPAGRLTARVGPRLPMAIGLLLAAVVLALLTQAGLHTGYLVLLPALLLWGIGMGFLTPAVVAAAMAAVPRARAGLASAVNNASRQAGGAIGIAAFGAVAGSPAHPRDFVAGMHTAALIGATLYVLAAIASAALIRDRTVV